jgi:hypothetical protein
MHVDRRGLATSGKIALNQVPFDFTWKENFAVTKSYPTQMTLAGPISGGQWTALHLPLEAYVKGPAFLKVLMQGKGAKILTQQGTFDLSVPEISYERLDWLKPAGGKALLSFRMEKEGERRIFKKISYRDDKLTASGSLSLSPQDDVEKAVLDSFKNGQTSLSARLVRSDAGYYDLALKAADFDARTLIKKSTESKEDEKAADLPNFRVTARADHVTAENGVRVHDFRATGAYENNLWKAADIKGKFENSKSFSLDLGPADKDRKIVIASEDAGEAARAFGLFQNAVGGALNMEGRFTGAGKNQKLRGEVEVKDFKVIKAPVLGNILDTGALNNMGDLLKGEGIVFERLNIPFTFQNGAIALDKSRGYGPSMGVTIEGGIDLRYNSLTLNGTIVPAYTLNSVLKIMPIVGNLLMGGKGEGLFAVTYKVTGPVAAPKVDVNHLAVLAPGFLRSIISAFGGAGTKVSPERKAAEKKAAEEAKKRKDQPAENSEVPPGGGAPQKDNPASPQP